MVKSAKLQDRTVHKDTTETGHNGPDLETFHVHVGQIIRAAAQVAAVKKGLKAARRSAQDAGLILKDLDEIIAMREEEPETVQATIRRKAQYATWMGLAPNVQGDLFAAGPTEDDEAKAEKEGYIDGLEGATAQGDRYDTANPLGQARLRGWNRGQGVLQQRLIDIGEAHKAQEEKPARKKPKLVSSAPVAEAEQHEEMGA